MKVFTLRGSADDANCEVVILRGAEMSVLSSYYIMTMCSHIYSCVVSRKMHSHDTLCGNVRRWPGRYLQFYVLAFVVEGGTSSFMC